MNINYITLILASLVILINFLSWKKNKLFVGIFSTFLILVIYSVFAKKDTPQETLNVVCSPDYKPFCYLKNGKITGLDLELLEAISKKLNKKLNLQSLNFSFIFEEIKKNKNKIGIGGFGITAERKKYMNMGSSRCRKY